MSISIYVVKTKYTLPAVERRVDASLGELRREPRTRTFNQQSGVSARRGRNEKGGRKQNTSQYTYRERITRMAKRLEQRNNSGARGSENSPVRTSEGQTSKTATSAYEGMVGWVHPLATCDMASGLNPPSQQITISRNPWLSVESRNGLEINCFELIWASWFEMGDFQQYLSGKTASDGIFFGK